MKKADVVLFEYCKKIFLIILCKRIADRTLRLLLEPERLLINAYFVQIYRLNSTFNFDINTDIFVK